MLKDLVISRTLGKVERRHTKQSSTSQNTEEDRQTYFSYHLNSNRTRHLLPISLDIQSNKKYCHLALFSVVLKKREVVSISV